MHTADIKWLLVCNLRQQYIGNISSNAPGDGGQDTLTVSRSYAGHMTKTDPVLSKLHHCAAHSHTYDMTHTQQQQCKVTYLYTRV